jgi:hypothetical protein
VRRRLSSAVGGPGGFLRSCFALTRRVHKQPSIEPVSFLPLHESAAWHLSKQNSGDFDGSRGSQPFGFRLTNVTRSSNTGSSAAMCSSAVMVFIGLGADEVDLHLRLQTPVAVWIEANLVPLRGHAPSPAFSGPDRRRNVVWPPKAG